MVSALNNIGKSKVYASLISTGILLSSGLIVMKKIQQRKLDETIIYTAKQYLGIKEIPQNKGFYDKYFEEKLRLLGWQKGWDWCLFYVKLVLLESFQKLHLKQLYNIVYENFSKGRTQETWENLRKINTKHIEIISNPQPGAIAFWRKWKYDKNSREWIPDKYHGHTGIVSQVYDKTFMSIEGNLNNAVTSKQRFTDYTRLDGTLQLLGFIKFKI